MLSLYVTLASRLSRMQAMHLWHSQTFDRLKLANAGLQVESRKLVLLISESSFSISQLAARGL